MDIEKMRQDRERLVKAHKKLQAIKDEPPSYHKTHWLQSIYEEQRDKILDVQNITVFHPDGHPIINNVNIIVWRGEIVVIMGQSGSGKTTLVKTLIGEQDLNFTGRVEINGVDTTHNRDAISRTFGYVPQELDRIYTNMSANENIHTFGRQYGIPTSVIEERADSLFNNLNIMGKQRDTLPVSQLSGGEQRRVSMAVGMIHEPDILLLDEPTSGLDPKMRYILWEYIEKLNRAYGTATIVVTHFPEESTFSHKIAVFMRPQGFIEYGKPSQILQKLPGNGYAVEIQTKLFDNRACQSLRNSGDFQFILEGGERLRIFADTPVGETVGNAVGILTALDIDIFSINPKSPATMNDYFEIHAGD